MERLMKPFRLRSSKDRKPLSEEQKRKRARFLVYPLMFLLCLGSFYLIFSPSGQERERQDKGQGFNTEIPSPEDSRLEWNKKDAYEKALMEQESRKRKTFFEAAESMFAKEERKDSVHLPDDIPSERQTNTGTETEKGNAGPVSSSAGAYREMNRTLGSIYEPRTDPEKERLLERIEELERMQQQQQKQEPLSGMEEKMALMEKSYELAAKYNNRQAAETPSPVRKAEDKKVIPVKQVHNEVVSSLSSKYSINSLVYWVTYVHNVVYSFYRSMIYCYINSTQRCAGSIVIDIIPTNGADKRKFFPFAPYFPVTNVIKRYFYPYFPAIIGIKGYSFPYFPYLSGIMKIKTALYSLFSRLDWHKTVVFPCLGEIYEGIRSLSWEIPVT